MSEDPFDRRLDRRELLGGVAATAFVTAAPAFALAKTAAGRVRPGGLGWPDAGQWASLRKEAGDRLAPVNLPKLQPDEAATLLRNPYYIRD